MSLLKGKYMRYTILMILLICCFAFAEISMPSIFSDGMVIQSESIVPVWGTAAPYEKVDVKGSWMTRASTTRADKSGFWMAKIKTPKPEKTPCQLTIKTTKEFVIIDDVLCGEVWLFCGDENMQMPVSMAMNGEFEVQNSNYPDIRCFTVPEKVSDTASADISAKWKQCNSMNVGSFNAAAYYFAKKFNDETRWPIGVISVTCNSTTIESWMSKDILSKQMDMLPIVKRYYKLESFKNEQDTYTQRLKNWLNSPIGDKPIEPDYLKYSSLPSATYNAMLSPIVPYKVKGAFFMQANENLTRAYQYKRLLELLIADWRDKWGWDELPVYIVQVGLDNVDEDKIKYLPEFWESQDESLADIANTAIIATLDLNNANRPALGARLLTVAYANAYNIPNTVATGPYFKQIRPEGEKMRVFFDGVFRGFTTPGFEAVRCFEIAGIDRVFFPADVIIERNTLLLSSPQVKEPVAVRYGWNANKDIRPNLSNRNDLPARPFRSDRWDYKTKNNK